MVPSEALKMGGHGPCDLLRFLHLEKVADDLGVVTRLSG
jgi:hypothetical protein